MPTLEDKGVRFDEHGPLDAYEKFLHPAALEALRRGVEQYGLTWMQHYRPSQRPLENAEHTWEIHAETRVKQALEALDYGDVDTFIAKLGSAVGYMANMICKALYAGVQQGHHYEIEGE